MDRDELSDFSILGTQVNIQKGWLTRHYEKEESGSAVQEDTKDA